MTDELLPCPFCGGESRHYSRMNGDDFLQWKESHWVCCVEDDCGNQTCMHGSKESAFAAWNRRPKAAQKLVEGESELNFYRKAFNLIIKTTRYHSAEWEKILEIAQQATEPTPPTPSEDSHD
ncbi:MAG: Lar family restriction alleviation protein [Aquiluna sp.]